MGGEQSPPFLRFWAGMDMAHGVGYGSVCAARIRPIPPDEIAATAPIGPPHGIPALPAPNIASRANARPRPSYAMQLPVSSFHEHRTQAPHTSTA